MVRARSPLPNNKRKLTARIGWWIAYGLSLLSGVYLFSFPLSDTDFFWHLEAGRLIVETGTIPHEDTFSYTVAGSEWVTHEWLFEAISWLAFKAGQFSWICILRIIFVLLSISFPLLLYRKEPVSPVWLFICAATGLTILLTRIDWRPLIITTLLFSVFLYILENFIERRSNILWPLPLLTIIWANWHSGVVFGLLLTGFYMLCEYFGRKRDEKIKQGLARWLRLALVLAWSFACSLINPNTIDVLLYPVRLGLFYSGTFLVVNTIDELQNLTLDIIPAFWFSVVICIAGIIFSWRNLNWRHAIILIALIVASIYRLRLTEIYVPAFLSFAPGLIQSTGNWTVARFNRKLAFVSISGITVAALVLLAVIIHASFTGPPKLGLSKHAFPGTICDWIEEHDPPGNMYNQIGTGGYLIHRLGPDQKVFWDGRLLVYEDIFQKLAEGQTINDIQPIDWAIDLPVQSGTNPYSVDAWALVAFDANHTLQINRHGASSDLIPGHEYFMLAPYIPEEILRNISDYPEDLRDTVRDELDRFHEESESEFANGFVSAGYMMLGGENMETAKDIITNELSSDPLSHDYLHSSAMYDYLTGDFEEAEKTIRSAMFWWPRALKSRVLYGRIVAAQDNHRAAAGIFRKVISEGYSSPHAYLYLANEEFTLGNMGEALEALELYFQTVLQQDYETREYARAVELGHVLMGT